MTRNGRKMAIYLVWFISVSDKFIISPFKKTKHFKPDISIAWVWSLIFLSELASPANKYIFMKGHVEFENKFIFHHNFYVKYAN